MNNIHHTSHFRLVSIGVVAADKNDGSKYISVFPRNCLGSMKVIFPMIMPWFQDQALMLMQ